MSYAQELARARRERLARIAAAGERYAASRQAPVASPPLAPVDKTERAARNAGAYAEPRSVPKTFEVLPLKRRGKPVRRETGTTLSAIQDAVADFYKITVVEMISPTRRREIVDPRSIAMYLAYETTGLSFESIGAAFCRDHTTALTRHRKVAALIETDADTRMDVAAIKTRLGL